MSSMPTNATSPVWFNDSHVGLEQLEALSTLQTCASTVPHASQTVHDIPVYEGAMIRSLAEGESLDPGSVRTLQQEWVQVLLEGAGVLVVRDAFDDLAMLDEVTSELNRIMADESGAQRVADHFAAAGSNTRLWNAHEKLCVQAPELFARYNANDTVSLVCKAWLGPAYQITAQANIVHPGGRAQVCHRDYHMGFQEAALLSHYPAHVHAMSPMLTLQAGIAHSAVPLESGPTQFLPFSQRLLSGYIDVAHKQVRDYFNTHRVQLALNKGDMMFFNPALMHAAGDNDTTDVHRFVNLLQIGSAYGRTMELLDRTAMAIRLYPVLQVMKTNAQLSSRGVSQVVEACAEGYAFPANMDLEPPSDGLAPASQQRLMLAALDDSMPVAEFAALMHRQQALKRSC